jgi:hypothetical protein
MKKAIIVSLMFMLFQYGSAQNYSRTIALCKSNFTVKGAVQEDRSLKITITDIDDASNKVEYIDNSTDVTTFMTVFQNHFLKLKDSGGNAITCSDGEKNTILTEGNKLWYQLLGTSIAPKAGVFTIADRVSLKIIEKSGLTALNSDTFDVKDVHIEINNGYIESIYAIINAYGREHMYINWWGIGFSSFSNYHRLLKIPLVEINKSPYDKVKDKVAPVILLGELLKYKPELAVDRRDYSPKDTSFTLSGGQSIQMYKEETNKLFEARIFSDFVGLNENKPNGLIQTEMSKRINLNTKQYLAPRYFIFAFNSYGTFQYIAPSITLSKLEEHNKRLVLGDLDSVRYNPGINDSSLFKNPYHRYATALDLYQHQSFSAGFDANFIYLSNHNLKYTFYLNGGARLGLTPVADSITSIDQNSNITKTGLTNEYTVNTIQFYPEIKLIFLPEERFNFSISDEFVYLKPLSKNILLVSFDKENYSKLNQKKSAWINVFELLMTLNVNPRTNGKIFGRVRFNSEMGNSHNNFAQIQIGYSAYILGNK